MDNTEEIIELDKKYVMNTYARLPVVFTEGKGMILRDAAGKEYLDFVGGIAVASLGHAPESVAEALCEQANTLIMTSNLFYTEQQARLAEKLIGLTFPGKVFFANSGAEANEAAFKIARKCAGLRGVKEPVIVSAERSFHGRTLATLAATGQPVKQQPFKPIPQGFVQVPYNDVKALNETVGEDTAAVILELVQGEGGVYVADHDYALAAREVCNRTGALLIIDEVQTGFGRTGTMFAYEQYGIKPDIMTIAKGLGGGVPIGATIAAGKIADVLEPGEHGTTFGGSPLVCRAALAVIDTIQKEGLVGNSAGMGIYLMENISLIAAATGKIKNWRGLGLMIAADLNAPLAGDVVMGCLKRGLIINKTSDMTLRFLPPLIVLPEQIDLMAEVLTAVLEEL